MGTDQNDNNCDGRRDLVVFNGTELEGCTVQITQTAE